MSSASPQAAAKESRRTARMPAPAAMPIRFPALGRPSELFAAPPPSQARPRRGTVVASRWSTHPAARRSTAPRCARPRVATSRRSRRQCGVAARPIECAGLRHWLATDLRRPACLPFDRLRTGRRRAGAEPRGWHRRGGLRARTIPVRGMAALGDDAAANRGAHDEAGGAGHGEEQHRPASANRVTSVTTPSTPPCSSRAATWRERSDAWRT